MTDPNPRKDTPTMSTIGTLRDLTGDFHDELAARLGSDGIAALVTVLDELDERYADGEPDSTSEHWSGALMLAYGDGR